MANAKCLPTINGLPSASLRETVIAVASFGGFIASSADARRRSRSASASEAYDEYDDPVYDEYDDPVYDEYDDSSE